jgi:hypothetical protein
VSNDVDCASVALVEGLQMGVVGGGDSWSGTGVVVSHFERVG